MAAEDVFDLLAALVDKSLLVVRQTEDGPRYRMLEIIRAYGRERLAEAGETEEVRRRHAAYFLRLAESSQHTLLGGGQLAWLRGWRPNRTTCTPPSAARSRSATRKAPPG